MTGIEVIQVHPDLRVVGSNRLNGNMYQRFSDGNRFYESRMRVIGAAGCDKTVAILPGGRDTYQDLEQGTIVAPKEAYSKWQEDLQPVGDIVYDPEDPPYMVDLPADGLITRRTGNGLMLNAADCAPTVIYDPRLRILALAHNGREGATLGIGPKLVDHMRRVYGTRPPDLVVHFGASIAPESYVLPRLGESLRQEAWRPYLREVQGGYETDIVGLATQNLLDRGVTGGNITRSPIDTFAHPDYFSFVEHSGNKSNVPDGRNGFIAVMRKTELQPV